MGHPKKLIVIGGGAAGFFCAVNAARLHPGLSVMIVERSSKLLTKVKVSGGGRCNVTHACFDIETLITKYPRGKNFLKKAFHHFNTSDTVEWFTTRGVALKEEADGRMFPQSNSSQTIIDCLLKEADKYRVHVVTNCHITSISKSEQSFNLLTANGETLTADFLCIACGGFAKTAQFDWIIQTGHTIQPPAPSLFTFNMPGNSITALMGIAVPQASVKIQGSKLAQKGPLLITHWGLSGPAVLKLSAYAARELAAVGYRFSVLVNWIDPYTEQQLRNEWTSLRNEYAAMLMHARNPFGLPARLWQYLLAESEITETTRWADVNSKQQNKLIQLLTGQLLEVSGKTTFKEEFVTCGGITLGGIDVNTMQSKLLPGLYFAGEVMDVDGITGGFNFQHAWTSGFIAASNLPVP